MDQLASRATPVQQRSRDTVRRILDAAEQLVAEHGLDGLSTTRLAAAAGISPGAVYQYFPTKQAILLAIAAECIERLVTAGQLLGRSGVSPATCQVVDRRPPEAFVPVR